jgi:hypothetical protein
VEEYLSPPSAGGILPPLSRKSILPAFYFFMRVIMEIEILVRSVKIMNEKEWIDIEAAYTNQNRTIIVYLWALPLIGEIRLIPAGGIYYLHS